MTLKKYDTNTDEWKSGAVLDGIWDGHRKCVFINDRFIIILGASIAQVAPLLDVLCVDIRTGEVRSLKAMPSYRMQMSVVHYDNEIYAIGGRNGSTTLRSAAK